MGYVCLYILSALLRVDHIALGRFLDGFQVLVLQHDPCDAGDFSNKYVYMQINVKVFIKVMEVFKVRCSHFAANSCL